jgi:hypothetical protein
MEFAHAADFPIGGAFGAQDACALYRFGGGDAVLVTGTKTENGRTVFF